MPPVFPRPFPRVPVPVRRTSESSWTEELRALVRPLDRRRTLVDDVGLRVSVRRDSLDRRTGREIRGRTSLLVSSQNWWWTRQDDIGEEIFHDWVVEEHRVVLSESWLLGRSRAITEEDRHGWRSPVPYLFDDLSVLFRNTLPERVDLGGGKVKLVLANPRGAAGHTELVVDLARNVLLEVAGYRGEKRVHRTGFEDHFLLDGTHWPGTVVTEDETGEVVSTLTITVESLSPEDFSSALSRRGSLLPEAMVLPMEERSLADAKRSIADGKRKFEDDWVICRNFAADQRWEEAGPYLEALEGHLQGKRAVHWLKLTFLKLRRRNEELKQLAFIQAKNLVERPRPADLRCVLELARICNELAASERLALLTEVRPVFARQESRSLPLLSYDTMTIDLLEAVGSTQEAQARLGEVVVRYPDVLDLQLRNARSLAARGMTDAAIEALLEKLEKSVLLRKAEQRLVRTAIFDLWMNAYRLSEAVAFCETWRRDHPGQASSGVIDRYLSGLIFLDRVDKARGLITDWLQPQHLDGEVGGPAIAQLYAALNHALGQGSGMYSYRPDGSWEGILDRLARAAVDHPKRFDIAQRILTSRAFHRTRSGIALSTDLYAMLKSGVKTLPLEVLVRWISWLHTADYSFGDGERDLRGIMEELLARWTKSGKPDERDLVRRSLESFGGDLVLDYWRHRVRIGEGAVLAASRRSLFSILLGFTWTEDREKELVSLLPLLEVSEGEGPGKPGGMQLEERTLRVRIIAAYQLFGWLPGAKAAARIAEDPSVNRWTRRELARRRRAAVDLARREVVETLDRCSKESAKSGGLTPWLILDRLYYLAKLREDVEEIGKSALRLLDEVLSQEPAPDGQSERPLGPWFRNGVLATRSAATLCHIVSIGKSPEFAQLLIESLESELVKGEASPVNSRLWLYRLYVLLDRREELVRRLGEWAKESVVSAHRWGRRLAFLSAERGAFEEAVRLLQGIEAKDELDAEDYRSLAQWSVLLGDRGAERKALSRSYESVDEWTLRDGLQIDLHRVSRGGDGVPEELDSTVPMRLVTLFRKARRPSRHFHLLEQFYQATRDFRVLEGLAEAVIGQSSQGIYEFLGIVDRIAVLIQEEATVDRFAACLVGLHEKAITDTDRRCLRLVHFLVRSKALAQSHGTDSHETAVFDALRGADQGEFEPFERAALAKLLASLEPAGLDMVMEEIARILASIHESAPRGTEERIDVAIHRASFEWKVGHRDVALRILTAALPVARSIFAVAATSNRLDRLLGARAGYLHGLSRFREAETMWNQELSEASTEVRRRWVELRILETYRLAFSGDGETTLGRGARIYRPLLERILADLEIRSDEHHSQRLIESICSLFTTAGKRSFGNARDDLAEFAFRRLPPVLHRYQYRNGQTIVTRVAQTLDRVVGRRQALLFLIGRAENEPAWLSLRNEDFWARHSWLAASWRRKADLDRDAERRLLAIVLGELRKDLESGSSRNRSIYVNDSAHFWRERKDDFERVAEEVIRDCDGFETIVLHVARYFHGGLGSTDRAIRPLHELYRRGRMSAPGRLLLAEYLQLRSRHRETLPILSGLIEEDPDSLEPRLFLMRAYCAVGELARVATAAADIEARWREQGAWQEDVVARLASVCVETELHEVAIACFAEAINLHVRGRASRGVGDRVLASYYREKSQSLQALGRTDEAVDAAAGAIVSWGPHQKMRRAELRNLERILRAAVDLEALLRGWDRQSKESGLENPILRKAAGKALLVLGKPSQAVEQLEIAADHTGNDLELLDLLVDALDRAGRRAEGTERLLEAARVAGRETSLFVRLGDRLGSTDGDVSALRAYTNTVEMLPRESESHSALAAVFDRLGMSSDAVIEWRQVVRIRPEEPAGFLGLARGLADVGRVSEARRVLEEMIIRGWNSRFGDVASQAKTVLSSVGDSK